MTRVQRQEAQGNSAQGRSGRMAMSRRTRDKGARKAAKLLPPGTVVREYVRGRAQPRMTTGAIVAIVLFVLVFVAALATGRIIFPGVLLLIWVDSEIRPHRAVVVTALGVVLMTHSIVTGRSTLIGYLPFEAALQPVPRTGKPKLQLGPDLLTLSAGDHKLLFAAAAAARNQLSQAPAAPAAPTYNPSPNFFG
ncbi:MAG: hypothetical protein ABI912_02590 [Actinomycetota bacterium]